MRTDAAPIRVDRARLKAASDRGTLLSLWGELCPDTPAVISDAGVRTFRELNARSNRLARAFRAAGLRAGDGVALVCSNRPEFVEVQQATARTGLRLTPVNWHLGPEETRYILDNCAAKVLIVDARFSETLQDPVVRSAGPVCRLSLGGDIAGFDDYEAFIAPHSGDDIGDPCAGTEMMYTSGTTGRPKGVAFRAGPQGAYAVSTVKPAGYRAGMGHRHLCTGPLYHSAPLITSMRIPLACGAAVVLMDGWDAERTLSLIEHHQVTHTHMVPTMFHGLLALPDEVKTRYDLSSLQFVIHGAAPCPLSVKRAMIDWWGPIIWEYYGATEGMASLVDSQDWLERPGTVGRPPGADHVRVLDEAGQPCAPGEVGNIFIRSPAGGFRYHEDPAKTESSFRGDHFTLGDVGYLDEDGYLFLTDRSVDLIISGGVNVYPAATEARLLEHPEVEDAAVIGVPSEEWGEEVKAVVQLKSGSEGSPELAEALVGFCRAALARYQSPRSVDFVVSLPRQDNGKLYKRELREAYRRRS